MAGEEIYRSTRGTVPRKLSINISLRAALSLHLPVLNLISAKDEISVSSVVGINCYQIDFHAVINKYRSQYVCCNNKISIFVIVNCTAHHPNSTKCNFFCFGTRFLGTSCGQATFCC